MLNQIANFVMDNFLLILAVLIALITLLFYLLFKEKKERKEEKKRLTEPQLVDVVAIRIQSHILNNIWSLSLNTRELDSTHAFDQIQSLIADIPQVISYFKQHYSDYASNENFVSVVPCIPENIITPHQMMALSFVKGKCLIPLEQIKNIVEIPKKPYWIFLVSAQKIEDPNRTVCDRSRSGLSCNELIRAVTQYEQLWRERANQLISNGCLVKESNSPIAFRYNLATYIAELSSICMEKKCYIRENYILTCLSRACFK